MLATMQLLKTCDGAQLQVTINRALMDTLTENEKKALVNSDPSNMLEYNEVTQQVLRAAFPLSRWPECMKRWMQALQRLLGVLRLHWQVASG